MPIPPDRARDKTLFTPGPLTTSRTVKQAMLRDLGSRDFAFIELVRDARARLLALAGVSQATGYEAVLVQGSGTFGVEAVLGSCVPRTGKLLVIANGAYGERMLAMAAVLGIPTRALRYAEDALPVVADVERALAEEDAVTTVAVVHCETTTGIVNPIAAIGAAVRRAGKTFCVDAMSSFGAIPLDLAGGTIDFLMTSANKCLEGTPGVAIVLARRTALEAADAARSLSLDLRAQWRGLEANGQFRFTPPTHVILGLAQALDELEAEGGVCGRAERYRTNHAHLVAGMRGLGFREYLRPEDQGYIITSFRYPADPHFSFEPFYDGLNRRDLVIYPGKVSQADCFRIGTIGRIFPADIDVLLAMIRETLIEMGVALPLG